MKQAIFDALSKNINYRSETILGVPGTYLDTEIFYDDAPFLKDSPFLSTLIANPNHIGCHTLGDEHENMFSGTQEIEKNLIKICAEEIFKAEHGQYDGYVASGGTEANIEAIWIYRNYFVEKEDADLSEICIISSEDTHYSIHKASNLLNISNVVVQVNEYHQISIPELERNVSKAIHDGKKYFIVVLNMSTTMFGSVDDINAVTNYFNLLHLNYKLHIDAAYGGFIYPFTNNESNFNFKNPDVSSVSIDGHKMLQAPYGTGILLIRKNYMPFVCNDNATYVNGKDYTLVGSRSGANAICMWMILHAHGSEGWTKKMRELTDKTSDFCAALSEMEVEYYRNPYLNIVAIKSKYVSAELAKKFVLVPDTHEGQPQWYKVVVMPHVHHNALSQFINELALELQ
ncbi:MAG: aspartate aminotransferase family protein [Sphingobacteriaceae bacterium]|nr:aspartate aminotransferase family protein [Sphingobacteriaceae bacterium]